MLPLFIAKILRALPQQNSARRELREWSPRVVWTIVGIVYGHSFDPTFVESILDRSSSPYKLGRIYKHSIGDAWGKRRGNLRLQKWSWTVPALPVSSSQFYYYIILTTLLFINFRSVRRKKTMLVEGVEYFFIFIGQDTDINQKSSPKVVPGPLFVEGDFVDPIFQRSPDVRCLSVDFIFN